MDCTLETTYGTTFSANHWEELGVDSVRAADPDEVEEYLDDWDVGQRVRRPVKLRMMLDRIELFEERAQELNAALAKGDIGLSEWETKMGGAVKRLHVGSYMIGKSGRWDELTEDGVRALESEVDRQLKYLRRWRNELAEGGRLDDLSEGQLNTRSRLYGAASSGTFEQGYQSERGLPPGILPAQPGDGTTKCLTNCRCRWSIRTFSKEKQNFDCNWMLGAAEHCETCRERAREWLGLRIRGGELIDDPEPIFYER